MIADRGSLSHRFPPPWSVDELEACFVVKDGAGQKLAYVYYENDPGPPNCSAKMRLDGLLPTLQNYPNSFDSLSGRDMRQISSGKAAENERKYPYVVAIAIASNGLDIELSRQIMAFHNARRIQPRHGRSTIPKGGEGETYYRWCFSDLETAQSFVETFGGTITQK
jgi:hypothetical protein